MHNWNEFEREDLQAIPHMLHLGFMIEFNHKDELNHRVTPEMPPMNSVSFVKGNFHIWQIKTGWQTAFLIRGSYTGHKPFKSLDEAVARLRFESITDEA